MPDEDQLQSQIQFLERENRKLRRTLRDDYAKAALAGLLANASMAPDPKGMIGLAFSLADAALKER